MSRNRIRKTAGSLRFTAATAIAATLAACATPDAPAIRGRWKPLDAFAPSPQAIPLREQYLFRAYPADGTLRAMLARWARDGGMALSYQHPYDYTLHAPVARIRSADIQAALSAVASAYAEQDVEVSLDGGRIVVRALRDASGTGS